MADLSDDQIKDLGLPDIDRLCYEVFEINEKSAIEFARAAIAADRALNAPGDRHLTVTTDAQDNAVLVSWQDDEHRILEIVWERDAPAVPDHFPDVKKMVAPAVLPSATAVAWHYPNGKPYTLTWAGDDEARLAPAAAQFGLTRTPLVAAVQPSADKVDAERYRHLREHGDTGCTEKDGFGGQTLMMGDALDAAIDAARARTGGPA